MANLAIKSETAKSEANYAARVINGEQTMTSLQIAEVTGKQHAHVMRDIRSLLEQGVQESNFGLSYNVRELPNRGTKQDPYYVLTKEGCLILASGYNALLREKIIQRWITLEEAERNRQPKVPTTFKEALLLAVAQQEQIEAQQSLIAEQAEAISEMQPKVSYCDIILQSPSTVIVTQIAQDYGMSAKAFNKKLHELGIQRKVGRQWVLYSQYISSGYVQSATEPMRNSSSGRTYTYSRWTQKGRIFLYNELKNRGVLPLIEQG